MKHMLELWDNGPSNDKTKFTAGPLGVQVQNLSKNLKAFVEYLPMPDCEIPVPDKELLKNNDIRNFYLLGFMIITGIPNNKLLNIKLPPISKARWYTFAIRLLRLYVQTTNPSIQLTKCVRFILKFYLNLSLTVKMSPLVQGNNIIDYIAHLKKTLNEYIYNQR